MPLLFIVTVHIMLVPLISLLSPLQEARLLLYGILKGNKTWTTLKLLEATEICSVSVTLLFNLQWCNYDFVIQI